MPPGVLPLVERPAHRSPQVMRPEFFELGSISSTLHSVPVAEYVKQTHAETPPLGVSQPPVESIRPPVESSWPLVESNQSGSYWKNYLQADG